MAAKEGSVSLLDMPGTQVGRAAASKRQYKSLNRRRQQSLEAHSHNHHPASGPAEVDIAAGLLGNLLLEDLLRRAC